MESQTSKLEAEFRRRGVLTAREAAHAIGVSQPTISRLISDMGEQRLLRLGGGRSTRYALRRSLRVSGSVWPLYRVTETGDMALTGHLHVLMDSAWCLSQDEPWETLHSVDFRDGLYPGIPWLLHDLRPQGFLGRCFARRHAVDLSAPADPRRWNDDDEISALLRFGSDLSGDLVLGDDMRRVVQERMMVELDGVDPSSRQSAYPDLARAALAGEWSGSSAAGEQPKFTACVHDVNADARHVIVKFSGAGRRAEDRRWADLLIAEHVANTVLRDSGVRCAETTVLKADGRTFLESTRFDRAGAHGRRGLVSLASLDDALFGALDSPWTVAAERLCRDGWISGHDAVQLSFLWWFGSLIGNTDMHYGNVSLHLASDRPLVLAPTYDMVPMHYRPDAEGRVTSGPLRPAPPPPQAAAIWGRAASLAARFWSVLAQYRGLSADFQRIATDNTQVVETYREKFGR